MVLVVDGAGRVHGWDVKPATASWRMTGLSPSGRTAVHIDIDGPMRRQTKDLPTADLVVHELEEDENEPTRRRVMAKRYADHILHCKPDPYGLSWRLECLPGIEHFTADLEEWTGTADELEAEGVAVDRTRCWVHDHLDNLEQEEWMKGTDWPEDGPWRVVCSYVDGLDVSYVPDAPNPEVGDA